MKKAIIFGLAVLSLGGLTACPESGNTNTASTNRTSNANSAMTSNTANSMNNSAITNNASRTAVRQDDFYTNAAQSGMAEVEIAKLALQKSQNADVKKFARMMVADHTKANDELKALAGKKNVTLPASVSGGQKTTMDDLSKLSGAEFDKNYVETMVKDHEKTIALFEDNTTNADADIKSFTVKTLPNLKKHLDMINEIQSKMK